MFAQTSSSRPPQLPFKDSPFSIHGRFNRMSYLGGYGLIYLVTLLGYFILASFLGSFQLSSNLFNFEFYSSLSGASALVVWAFSLFLIYLNIVLVVRRLHDLNKSGWMGLLLFIPVVQFFYDLFTACLRYSRSKRIRSCSTSNVYRKTDGLAYFSRYFS